MLAASSTLSQEATTDHAVQDLVAFASQYSNYFPPRPSPLRSRPIGKDVVLVTGTTGNFGCELLESLLLDNSIGVVYAINRRGTHASDRQRAMFRAKGIDESLLGSPKLKLIEGDLGMFEMGLEDRIYNEIRSSVTHIIHNAWQVNFNLSVKSFDSLLRSLRSLVNLSLSSPYVNPPKIQFVSSISVFQNYTGSLPIPEEPIEPEFALGSGYGESKWAAEKILLDAADKTDVSIQIIRLGQVCGDRKGFWSPSEWFPAIFKSSEITYCLPELDGAAAFIPAYAAAQALVEMRYSGHAILHLVHPRPARLRALLECAAREIGVPLKSYNIWLNTLSEFERKLRAESSREDYIRAVSANPALMLLDSFKALKFSHGAEMRILSPISTEQAAAASLTLEYITELDEHAVMLWLTTWRDRGFL